MPRKIHLLIRKMVNELPKPMKDGYTGYKIIGDPGRFCSKRCALEVRDDY